MKATKIQSVPVFVWSGAGLLSFDKKNNEFLPPPQLTSKTKYGNDVLWNNFKLSKTVLRIRMFLDLPDSDPLARHTDTSIIKQK
jgi:hypothetical protein